MRRSRCSPRARALESEAPYFVDFVEQELPPRPIDIRRSSADVYTTLDLHLQRLAQDAVRSGLARVDDLLARRRRKIGPAQAALIAVDPRTGEILAMVGGRSYNQSQFNRVTAARRQPGSVFKPFVFLAAFEQALADGRTDLTPATVVTDEPTTFLFEDKDYEPGNYDGEYDGPITLRRALARSRNVATVKVAEMVGYDKRRRAVAASSASARRRSPIRRSRSASSRRRRSRSRPPTRSSPNGGEVRPLRAVHVGCSSNGGRSSRRRSRKGAQVARPETTYLVTNMMRSVAQRRHRRERAARRASSSTPPASPARPTICATPGSSASRPSC